MSHTYVSKHSCSYCSPSRAARTGNEVSCVTYRALCLFGHPIVFDSMTVFASDRANLFACKVKCRMWFYVRYYCGFAADFTSVQVLSLYGLALESGNSFLQFSNTFGHLSECFPNGCFIEDFQNV